jgi:hypothetical protein
VNISWGCNWASTINWKAHWVTFFYLRQCAFPSMDYFCCEKNRLVMRILFPLLLIVSLAWAVPLYVEVSKYASVFYQKTDCTNFAVKLLSKGANLGEVECERGYLYFELNNTYDAVGINLKYTLLTSDLFESQGISSINTWDNSKGKPMSCFGGFCSPPPSYLSGMVQISYTSTEACLKNYPSFSGNSACQIIPKGCTATNGTQPVLTIQTYCRGDYCELYRFHESFMLDTITSIRVAPHPPC